NHTLHRSRKVMHSLPTDFSVDGVGGIRDPRSMIGDELGVDLHVVSCDHAATRNLVLAVERAHLGVDAVAAAPYVAGLAVLEPDEAEMGAIVIDMGAHSTSLAIFSGGALVHVDAVRLGGDHVTMDLARGLEARLTDAERLKTLYGAALASPSDDRETVAFDQVGEAGEHPARVPKSHLVRIIRPRVEETLEFLRDRLAGAGYPAQSGRRIVLTGGACQLTGVAEVARRILGGQVRVGGPLGADGLPDSVKSPAFAAAVGLLIYPQFAGREYFEHGGDAHAAAPRAHGYMSRVGRWLKESF
ncbi:MAG: cell division protein FtsA, partial [Methylocystis sp.]|nr:cell division protein FtsA [Methylocystis sp.]